MDDSLIISHVENECASPTISLLQSGTFYVVISDTVSVLIYSFVANDIIFDVKYDVMWGRKGEGREGKGGKGKGKEGRGREKEQRGKDHLVLAYTPPLI